MPTHDQLTGVLPPEIIGILRNEWTAPFWDAAAEHRLVLPRCASCGTYRFPPSPFCPVCRTQAVQWVEHDGAGTIYSFTVIRHGVIPEVRDALPLVAAVVELPGTGGVRLVGNVVDAAPEAVAVGLPVTLDWYDVRAGDTVPIFRLA
jgi:uncharacterized OB-fold protein